MPDDRNIQHDKKVIQQKKHEGQDLAKGAEHVPQPGKKTAHEKPHGAHKETEAEKSGGSVAEPTISDTPPQGEQGRVHSKG